MSSLLKYIKNNFSLVILSGVFLIALLNPVLKKYDYGAGFPIVILFSVLLFFIVLYERKHKKEKAGFEKSLIVSLIALFILGFLNSQTQNIGFSEVLAFTSVFITYLVFAYQKPIFIRRFLKVVAISSLLAVVLGYFLYIYWPEPRMVGPFFNLLYHAHLWPNAFALFLLSTWPIFLLYFEKKNSRTNFVFALVLGLLASAIFLSFSRGAMIAFLGQSILFIIYFFKRINTKILIFTLLSIVFAFSFVFSANYFRNLNHEVLNIEERISFANSESLTSKQERIDFWEGSIELIKEEPLTGFGPFSFRYAYNPIQENFLANADHPHNLFLKIGVEYGLITLIAFIAFLLTGFVTVLNRFSKLNKQNKDLLYILFVSVAGIFAHNLIDYNLNFFANLLLLFLFLAFIRSIVSNNYIKTNNSLTFSLSFLVFLITLFEGSVLVMAEVKDESYLKYSLFPRNYYLNTAGELIQNENFDSALEVLEIQTALNSLDAKAIYLRGVIYCNENFENFDLETCKNYLEEAIELNPKNEWRYYRDYARVLIKMDNYEALNKFVLEISPLILQYFNYVENNVHFTAYTNNVESAADLIEILIPYLSADEKENFIEESDKMLQTAENLRHEKTY